MICRSSYCGREFEKRKANCPHCDAPGVAMLYRYRPINNFFWQMLETRKMFSPKAIALNDPFEFAFHWAEKAIGGIPLIPAEVAKTHEDMRQMRVLCFSQIRDSILMWSHYADSHKGVCLGFERNSDPDNGLGNYGVCIPVVYRSDNSLQSFRPLELDHKATSKILTTKSLAWSYEHEWRLISKPDSPEIDYPAPLREVIFGLWTTNDDQTRIKSLLGDSVAYFKTTMSERYYVLNVEPIE